MTTDLAVLNNRVGALMAELEQAPDEYRETVQTELEQAQEVLAAAPRADYYVYALFRENGVPFYIGKGTGERWNWHQQTANYFARDSHRCRIIRKMQARGIEVPKLKIHEGLTEPLAHEYEIALIKAIGRHPKGPLVNATDGGEGASGMVHSPETRERIGAPKRGKKRPEIGAKISATLRALGRKWSPTERARMSAVHLGAKRTPETRAKMRAAQLGKKHTTEARAKMSVGMQGRVPWNKDGTFSPEARMKMSVAHHGQMHSPKTREKISDGLRDRPVSSETREKIRAKRLAYWDKRRAAVESPTP